MHKNQFVIMKYTVGLVTSFLILLITSCQSPKERAQHSLFEPCPDFGFYQYESFDKKLYGKNANRETIVYLRTYDGKVVSILEDVAFNASKYHIGDYANIYRQVCGKRPPEKNLLKYRDYKYAVNKEQSLANKLEQIKTKMSEIESVSDFNNTYNKYKKNREWMERMKSKVNLPESFTIMGDIIKTMNDNILVFGKSVPYSGRMVKGTRYRNSHIIVRQAEMTPDMQATRFYYMNNAYLLEEGDTPVFTASLPPVDNTTAEYIKRLKSNAAMRKGKIEDYLELKESLVETEKKFEEAASEKDRILDLVKGS